MNDERRPRLKDGCSLGLGSLDAPGLRSASSTSPNHHDNRARLRATPNHPKLTSDADHQTAADQSSELSDMDRLRFYHNQMKERSSIEFETRVSMLDYAIKLKPRKEPGTRDFGPIWQYWHSGKPNAPELCQI